MSSGLSKRTSGGRATRERISLRHARDAPLTPLPRRGQTDALCLAQWRRPARSDQWQDGQVRLRKMKCAPDNTLWARSDASTQIPRYLATSSARCDALVHIRAGRYGYSPAALGLSAACLKSCDMASTSVAGYFRYLAVSCHQMPLARVYDAGSVLAVSWHTLHKNSAAQHR
jgi:hypothetical protein